MDIATLLPHSIDALLIAPFRWFSTYSLGMWSGCAALACYCIVLGELTGNLLYLVHRRYYTGMQDDMVRYHNTSVAALHAGNKEVYLASNKLAQESFGKNFFAQASIGMSTLWPVPFALAWLALRFEGIPIYEVGNIHMGYAFIFITTYILLRLLFARYKKYLPLCSFVHNLKQRDKSDQQAMKALFK